MLNKVVKLTPTGEYRFAIVFADGKSGVFDFEPVLRAGGKTGNEALESSIFSQAFLDFGAVTWPNGYDICPDWLHMEMEKAGLLSRDAA